jgi:hypothetical protein
MVTSYEVISLNHLAEHMIYLSTASSFWFSLNSSYDHEFHLSKQLGITPQDYECPKRVGSFGSSTRFQMRKVVGK